MYLVDEKLLCSRRRWRQRRGRLPKADGVVIPDPSGAVRPALYGVRLVVLAPRATHSAGDKNSPAVALAGRILAQREAGPRLNRNMLVFAAAAANRLGEPSWGTAGGDEGVPGVVLDCRRFRRAGSKKRVYGGRKASFTTWPAPWRCLAMCTSAMTRSAAVTRPHSSTWRPRCAARSTRHMAEVQ